MPVATVGDCRVSGVPRSPRARQLLQKFWFDRHPEPGPYFDPSKDNLSYTEETDNSSPSFDIEGDEFVHQSGCRRKDSLDLAHFKARETLLNNIELKNKGFADKTPLLALKSLGCAVEASSNLLPLDLIQSSVVLEDTETELDNPHPASFNQPPPIPPPAIETCHNPVGGTGSKSYCSCKHSFKPRVKSYEEAIQKTTGRTPLTATADSRNNTAPQGTHCWCWSSKLVIYTIYLCIVFLLVIFTEAARLVMVPITVFLIVLSLALFLFILFCVCFIIFI